MTSTGVERTQESALKEGRSEKNREKIKDGIGRNICASKLLEWGLRTNKGEHAHFLNFFFQFFFLFFPNFFLLSPSVI